MGKSRRNDFDHCDQGYTTSNLIDRREQRKKKKSDRYEQLSDTVVYEDEKPRRQR